MVITFSIVFTSCIDWDYFGLSSNGEIVTFELEQQSGTSEIDSLNRLILVPLDTIVDRTSLAPTKIVTSNLATIKPGVGESQNFLDTVNYVVTAENGEQTVWKVAIKEAENQVPFSDFTTWFEEESGNSSYFLPGNSLESSPWRSGDKGAAEVNIPTYPRTLIPLPSAENAEYAKLETKEPIKGILAAGSLFVGNIQGSGFTDVQIDFGYPFTSKPVSFSVSIQYLPQSYQKDGQTIMDQKDVYVLLQVREDGKRYRLGTAWLPRSSDELSEWTEITVPLVFGQSDSFESYMQPSPSKEELPEVGYYSETNVRPTHIIIVFASSAEGADLVSGGVGSILKIKDFKLNY